MDLVDASLAVHGTVLLHSFIHFAYSIFGNLQQRQFNWILYDRKRQRYPCVVRHFEMAVLRIFDRLER